MRAILAHLVLVVLTLLAFTRGAAAEPALWRAEKNGSEIILFATLHVASRDQKGARNAPSWQTPEVVEAFARAGTIVLETRVIGAEAELSALLRERGVNRTGTPLRARLSLPDARRFETLAHERGLSLDGLDRLEPWLAALMIGQTLERDVGRDTLIDRVIEADARSYGKWLVYLETPAAQAGRLADMAPGDQMQFLISVLTLGGQTPADADALGRAWQSGDELALDQILNRDIRLKSPAVHAALIEAPTQAWAATLDQISLSDRTVFVAVGAAHMVGETGLLAALRTRGFTVSRIPAAAQTAGETMGQTAGKTAGQTIGSTRAPVSDVAPGRVTRAGL